MFKKFLKKTPENTNDKVKIASLLIHAAKIDENFTDKEKEIILKIIMNLNKIPKDKAENIFNEAQKKEQESNQIIEFTKEIKKNSMEYRLKIIEMLWKIVYSDGTSDIYESNLIRRVCGLLYISDKDSGEIKIKVINSLKRGK
tara:strand:+ start:1116 stop:1544 length:429 start_codon:yes stop_codon:yes gene_type:complete